MRTSGLLTITFGSVAAPLFAAASVSRWEYVTQPIAAAAITIPGTIHRLASDRLLVRWLCCPAIDLLLASFMSRPLEASIAEDCGSKHVRFSLLPRDGLEAALGNHRNCRVISRDRDLGSA
jgi:hypothetical protein